MGRGKSLFGVMVALTVVTLVAAVLVGIPRPPSATAGQRGSGRLGSRPVARPVNATLAAEFDRVAEVAAAQGIPGAVMAVSGRGLGTWEDTFGKADGSGTPMTLDDHFRIGSITKTFTATVILQLVDRGLLHLSDRLSRWEEAVPNAERITVKMLLNMTAGIWDEGGPGSLLSQDIQKDPTQVWTPQQIVDLAVQQGAAYPPGVVYYSDTNYVILGIIAQDVTQDSLGDLVQRHILAPLGMRQTSFPTTSLVVPSPATVGFDPTTSGYAPGPVMSPSALFGAGNMISTVYDLQIWARALGTGRLLEPWTQRHRLQFNPLPGGFGPLADAGVPALTGTKVSGTVISRGLTEAYGEGIVDAGGLLGHNGIVSLPGYTADLWYLPDLNASVVVLLNSYELCSGGTVSDAIMSTLAQVAFGSDVQAASLTIQTSCSPATSGA